MAESQQNPTRPTRRYSRGYLPHFDAEGFTQFVTFRLADSLPKDFLRQNELDSQRKLITDVEYHRRIDSYLDKGIGPAYLKDERIANSIAETLLKFDGVKYELHAWVVMPNHVHILFTPSDDTTLASIMHSIKSFTANFANNVLDLRGRFWSPEYFDRFIRDRVHYARVKEYVENNPVKAGLCANVSDWRWSSGGVFRG